MNFQVEKNNKYSIISVRIKSATIEHSDEFKAVFEELMIDKLDHLIIDLIECDFIDSTFMGALVRCHKEMQRKEGDVKIVCTGKVKFLLHDVTHLSSVMQLFDTVAEAVSDLY